MEEVATQQRPSKVSCMSGEITKTLLAVYTTVKWYVVPNKEVEWKSYITYMPRKPYDIIGKMYGDHI